MNKFYVTTAIDYVNDTIHLGHAFQKIAADVLARYYRITLGKDNVFFLTGTDEYGQKAEKAAKEQDISPSEFVKKISNRIKKNGDIYSGEYQGSYCEGCEAYYTKEDLIEGKCHIHPTLKIKIIKEENYFFKWSKYKDFLIEHINNNPDFIFPKHVAKEMLKFAKNIKDIPISRSNFTWGISVPNDLKQVVYVWFDALINYLTGVGFLENKKLFEKFWPADVHILGKDNLRWHALLWPAMLKSAGIGLPKTILVNGFLNINEQKISKSVGNVIRPSEWTKKYGADAVRYYLLRYTNIIDDSDISEKKLMQILQSSVNGIVSVANELKPFLPNTSEKIEEQFKGPKIISEKPLFPRI